MLNFVSHEKELWVLFVTAVGVLRVDIGQV